MSMRQKKYRAPGHDRARTGKSMSASVAHRAIQFVARVVFSEKIDDIEIFRRSRSE